MGNEEYWWLYDAAAAVLVIINIIISAKRGLVKAAFHVVGCILAVVLAFSMSGSVSASIYKNTIRSSNIDKIYDSMDSDYFVTQFSNYLESLDYNIVVKKEKLDSIFKSGTDVDNQLIKYINNINGKKVDNDAVLLKKIHEGYAKVIQKIVGNKLSKYAAASAAEILRDTKTNIDDFAPLVCASEGGYKAGATYIANNYIAKAYQDIIKLFIFTILFVLIILLTFAVVRSAANNDDHTSAASHAMGGIIGVVQGGIIVFAAAAIIRLYFIMGNDTSLFLENKAIDKTYVFKYAYNLIMKI